MADINSIFNVKDLERIRRNTPGLGTRVHLDNCGASLMSQRVVDTMKAFLEQEVSFGGYVAQEQHSEALEAVYETLPRVFGGMAKDYALTTSAVDAWVKAFYSVPMKAGDNIVTMYNEYCSNYVACLQRAKRDGVEIRVARPDAQGKLDLDHLESLIDDKTKLLSITFVPTSSGQVTDVQAIGNIVKNTNALFLLDACQAVGQIAVNFDDIGCHMATATSRKFLRGPRGVGFLYINEEARRTVDPVFLTNQSAAWDKTHSYTLLENARMFEDWERSCMVHLGFGAALEYLLALGPERVFSQTALMAKVLRQAVYALPNVVPTCPMQAKAAIITFNVQGKDTGYVKAALAAQGIAVQVSSIFHTRLDFEARNIDTTVRISPHYYNNQTDFNRFLEVLEAL